MCTEEEYVCIDLFVHPCSSEYVLSHHATLVVGLVDAIGQL